jgi:hypothetical protein
MGELSLEAVWCRFQRTKHRRSLWETLWRDCYTFALPQRGTGFGEEFRPGKNPHERLFDGTAPDAVEQLAASLLAELTPPWSAWFGLIPGRDVAPLERGLLAEGLDAATLATQSHFDRSNFAVEIHQAFLDLITVGSATLLFEEAPLGELSAFRFSAVPMAEIYFEAGVNGQIDGHFRERRLPIDLLCTRFPGVELPKSLRAGTGQAEERAATVVEAVLPAGRGFAYLAMLAGEPDGPMLLGSGHFEHSPFLSFRWNKGAGEVYGRSPVMTVLPDVKTLNKAVELTLKNASIAVTGIWQADDDGVLNPANIRLVPGAIIPKAVGSSGLTPLQAPGRFDISALVLDNLRARIRHSLLVDRLGPVQGGRMTATEVLVRSNEMTRLLGATYGRLQAELLTPLLVRAIAILARRGEVPELTLDGRTVDYQCKSPLARLQARQDVQNTMMWVESTTQMGPDAEQTVDVPATARWLGDRLGVPGHLMRDLAPTQTLLDLAALAGEVVAQTEDSADGAAA